MKTFEVVWRRTYEVRHRIEVDAKDEKSARKKFDKIVEDIDMNDHVSAAYPESEPDDILVYEPREL